MTKMTAKAVVMPWKRYLEVIELARGGLLAHKLADAFIAYTQCSCNMTCCDHYDAIGHVVSEIKKEKEFSS